ncbi:HAD family hydrolase [Actinacidiphila glaucinigra]|uniref:HAD family hydrolase n=1 Tax=Actinacidiphila glaucinigra TaxID=235986 RepID=UPI0015C6545A|nr:HAD-IA family hydrolase [Actinacidiphila glaucinigra]
MDEASQARLTSVGIECVLLDFDGPICRLFAGHPASVAASRLKARLGDLSLLPPELAGTDDPHGLLWEIATGSGGNAREVSAELNALLAKEEVVAAASATVTPGTADLVRGLRARGLHLGVVSNNGWEAIRNVLLATHLLELFDGPIVGRPDDARLMKPDGFMLREAVKQLGTKPERCLFVGDSWRDAEAARQVGVNFVGYAKSARKRREMTKANAKRVVSRMQDVMGLLP